MNELLAVLVGAVGPTGGLLWFMYHTTSITIPDIVSDHRKELAALSLAQREEIGRISESHRHDMTEIVMAFRADLKEERNLRETLLKQVLESAKFTCPMVNTEHTHLHLEQHHNAIGP